MAAVCSKCGVKGSRAHPLQVCLMCGALRCDKHLWKEEWQTVCPTCRPKAEALFRRVEGEENADSK